MHQPEQMNNNLIIQPVYELWRLIRGLGHPRAVTGHNCIKEPESSTTLRIQTRETMMLWTRKSEVSLERQRKLQRGRHKRIHT